MSLTAFQRIRRLQRNEAMKPENIMAREEVQEEVKEEVAPEVVEEVKVEEPVEERKPIRRRK